MSCKLHTHFPPNKIQMKQLIGTIDTTPKWVDMAVEMIQLIKEGEHIDTATEIIMDMAKKLDKLVEQKTVIETEINQEKYSKKEKPDTPSWKYKHTTKYDEIQVK